MTAQKINLQDPLVKIIGLTLAIIIATFFCANRFVIKPQRRKRATTEEKLAQLKLAGDIAKLKQQVTAREKDLSPQKEPSWLLTEITRLSQQARINVSSIQPLPKKKIDPYTYISFKVETNCTYKQLLEFIQFTEANRYLILIENIELKAPQSYKLEFTENELAQKQPIRLTVTMVVGTVY